MSTSRETPCIYIYNVCVCVYIYIYIYIYIFIHIHSFIHSQSFILFNASLLSEMPVMKAMKYLRRYKQQLGAQHILVSKSIRDLKMGVGFQTLVWILVTSSSSVLLYKGCISVTLQSPCSLKTGWWPMSLISHIHCGTPLFTVHPACNLHHSVKIIYRICNQSTK
jgi:hypothetical protein